MDYILAFPSQISQVFHRRVRRLAEIVQPENHYPNDAALDKNAFEQLRKMNYPLDSASANLDIMSFIRSTTVDWFRKKNLKPQNIDDYANQVYIYAFYASPESDKNPAGHPALLAKVPIVNKRNEAGETTYFKDTLRNLVWTYLNNYVKKDLRQPQFSQFDREEGQNFDPGELSEDGEHSLQLQDVRRLISDFQTFVRSQPQLTDSVKNAVVTWINMKLENPDIQGKEIAERLGVDPSQVTRIMPRVQDLMGRFLQAHPDYAETIKAMGRAASKDQTVRRLLKAFAEILPKFEPRRNYWMQDEKTGTKYAYYGTFREAHRLAACLSQDNQTAHSIYIGPRKIAYVNKKHAYIANDFRQS